jgi:hypothetical protein
MTEELTAEEREWMGGLRDSTQAKLLRLYDAARARAEDFRQQALEANRCADIHGQQRDEYRSSLIEATALLARVHQFGVPHPAIRKDIGAFLSRTPAPAATAEPRYGYPVGRDDLRVEPTLLERIEAECNDWEAHAFGNGAQSRLAMIHIRDLIKSAKAGTP